MKENQLSIWQKIKKLPEILGEYVLLHHLRKKYPSVTFFLGQI